MVVEQQQQIPVYIMSKDPKSNKAQLVQKMFNDNLFQCRIATMAIPKTLILNKNMPLIKAEEAYRVRKILQYSKDNNEDSIIIIKDSSVSNASPETIADVCRAVVDGADIADVVYLASWQEECDNLKNKRVIANKTTVIAKGSSPHGMQAILVSPKGRDILLGESPMRGISGDVFNIDDKPVADNLTEAVESNNILADVIVPSLFGFDVVNSKFTTHNLSKSMQCMTTPRLIPTDEEMSELMSQFISNKEEYSDKSSSVVKPALIFLILLFIIVAIILIVRSNRGKNTK